MYKPIFNKRKVFKFTGFSRRAYALFSVLGKEVIIGVLSVATLEHATASNQSMAGLRVQTDSTTTNSSIMLDEVQVKGTRAPMAESRQARMVTVLTRKQIEAAPVQSVNDLLKYAAAVDVRQKGPLGVLTDVSIRGGNFEQIAVLLNGVNIGDAQTGHNAFDYPFSIDDIERIEIVEGPAGRVYGASSLLGAINVVTKSPTKKNLTAHAKLGSYGYWKVGARGDHAIGQTLHSLSANYAHSDGYLRSKQGNLSADYSQLKSYYQGRYAMKNHLLKWHVGLSMKDFGANTFYSSRFDNQFEHTLKTYTAIASDSRLGQWHIAPTIYWHKAFDRFELVRGDASKFPFNYHTTDVLGANLNSHIHWQLGTTAFGIEWRRESISSTNLGETLSQPKPISGTDRYYGKGLVRNNIQVAVEHNLHFDRFSLSAGLVSVANSQSDMGVRFYPGVDVSYRLSDQVLAFGSWNTSLRMPSFTELYYSVGGHKADSKLKPEELSAIELGLKYSANAVEGKASFYHNRYSRLIDWIADGTTDSQGALVWQSVNFGRISAFGFQTQWRVALNGLIPQCGWLQSVDVAYNYLHQHAAVSEGIVSKYALEYLKHKFVGGLHLQPTKHLGASIYYRLQHRMGQYLNAQGDRTKYAGYGLVDAKLSWNAKAWSAYIEVNNLLNRKYLDYGNVPQPGAWFVSGVKFRL